MTDAAGAQPIQYTCTKCGYITVTQYGDALQARLRAVEAERDAWIRNGHDAIHIAQAQGELAERLTAEVARLRAAVEMHVCLYLPLWCPQHKVYHGRAGAGPPPICAALTPPPRPGGEGGA